MRTLLLSIAVLVGMQATGQQSGFVHNSDLPSELLSQLPKKPANQLRLLSEAIHKNKFSPSSYDSMSFQYSGNRTWNTPLNYWACDGAIEFEKNTSGMYDAHTRYVLTYNTVGEVTTVEWQEPDAQGNWNTYVTESITYQNGRMVISELIDHSPTPGIYGEKTTISYNTAGQVTETLYSRKYDAGDPWTDDEKTVNRYSPNGLSDVINYLLDMSTNTLEVADSTYYSYASGKLSTSVTLEPDGSSWRNVRKAIYHYSTGGLLNSFSTLLWQLSGPDWDTVEVYTPSYDADSRDTLWMVDARWNNSKIMMQHRYDAKGHIIYVSHKTWDDATTAWENDYEKYFRYAPFNVGINNKTDNTKNMTLYPVPASDMLHIDVQMERAQELHLSICSIDGRVLRSWNQPAGGNRYQEQVDISAIPPGSYLVRMGSVEGTIVQQFNIVK